jgi:CheY-like chemotaxis protein
VIVLRKKTEFSLANDIKILLLDDEEALINSIKHFLNKNGFDCIVTSDPDEAIRIVKEEKVDIFVVDYLMVGVTGVQVIDEIRKFNDNVYIMLLTGHANLMPPLYALENYDIDSYSEKEPEFKDLILKLGIAVKSLRKYTQYKEEMRDGLGMGERIKYLRGKLGLKQEDVAKELGVGRTTVTNYETGFSEPLLKHLRKLAAFFDVSIDYLLNTPEDSESESESD